MKILLTAFDPFNGETINPALESMKAVNANRFAAEIIKAEIPTVFSTSSTRIVELIAEHQPNAILCIGQAGGRKGLSLERVAINIMDASIPDNAGIRIIDKKIREDGENAYFSTLPNKAMIATMRSGGLDAYLSNSAGTFVCNSLLYTVLHEIHKKNASTKAGFLHVPYLPEQVIDKEATPFMTAQEITKGIELCIQAILDNPIDIAVANGSLH